MEQRLPWRPVASMVLAAAVMAVDSEEAPISSPELVVLAPDGLRSFGLSTMSMEDEPPRAPLPVTREPLPSVVTTSESPLLSSVDLVGRVGAPRHSRAAYEGVAW